ncbi:MAG: hypothetical protein AAF074_04620 [Pseudomonadota bacterium]
MQRFSEIFFFIQSAAQRSAQFLITLAAAVGAAIFLFSTFFGEEETPAPVPTAAPAVPESIPDPFNASLQQRLVTLYAQRNCAASEVLFADFSERLTPASASAPRDTAFLQLTLVAAGGQAIVRGNGRGKAALANARANLLDNIVIVLKEKGICD